MGRYLLDEEGNNTGIFVEKCSVDLSLEDVMDAASIIAISNFERDYKDRLTDPSFYCDIQEVYIDVDPNESSDENIFPKQLEPLIVKNESHLVWNNNYKPALSRRVYNTKYYRLIEKPYG